MPTRVSPEPLPKSEMISSGMLADCRKGRIDKILVKSISRFARNTTDCLEALRELKALGISVYFEEQNIDTTMVH